MRNIFENRLGRAAMILAIAGSAIIAAGASAQAGTNGRREGAAGVSWLAALAPRAAAGVGAPRSQYVSPCHKRRS